MPSNHAYGIAAEFADALRQQVLQTGESAPTVRGSDWRTGPVTAVNSDGTVNLGAIRARRLDSYLNPAVGDLVAVSQSGNGNWIVIGRCATSADGPWVSYTPVWTAATTNPTLGNGTLVGRYQRVGRTIHVHINLAAGSTSTFGAGNYSLSLPVAAANAGCTYVGNAHLLQSSRFGGQFVISPGASVGGPSFPDATLTPITRHSLWNPTMPLAFASTGQLRITATYEAAT